MAALLLLLRPAPCAPPSAAVLYNQSLTADDRFAYRGRQVTTDWHTGRSVAVLVAHRAPDLRRIDVLAPDRERGRAFASNNHEEWQFDPRAHTLTHRALSPDADAIEDAAARYSLLKNNYVLTVLPAPQTVAGRKTFVVTITRKVPRTLARRLWMDAATGLVLRRETYREDGKLAQSAAFTEIALRVPLPLSLFTLQALAHRPGVRLAALPPPDEQSLPLRAVPRQWHGDALAPAALRGYRLVSASVRGPGEKSRLHLRYSDGLNLVSLFEQKRTRTARTATRVPGAARTVRVGRRTGQVTRRASVALVNWDRDTLNLSLVGEVSEPVLLNLAAAADGSK